MADIYDEGLFGSVGFPGSIGSLLYEQHSIVRLFFFCWFFLGSGTMRPTSSRDDPSDPNRSDESEPVFV